MTYNRDTLFETLDGTVTPIAQFRYPVGRWTRHRPLAILAPRRFGYHLVRGPGVLPYLHSDLYVAEPCPTHGVAEDPPYVVTCRIRLTRVNTWTERVARLFAADCAEAVLLSERASGREPDERSWAAVAAARFHADGLIGDNELTAAAAVAWTVASAAGCVAWPTTWDAAQAVARSSAWPTAWSAASASESARASAESSAGLSSGSAAWAALYASGSTTHAPRHAALSTMFDRLLMYLNGAELPPVEPLYGPAMEVEAQ